jgi:hypothetical protein
MIVVLLISRTGKRLSQTQPEGLEGKNITGMGIKPSDETNGVVKATGLLSFA